MRERCCFVVFKVFSYDIPYTIYDIRDNFLTIGRRMVGLGRDLTNKRGYGNKEESEEKGVVEERKKRLK